MLLAQTWIIAAFFCVAIVIQELRWRAKRRQLDSGFNASLEAIGVDNAKLAGDLSVKDDLIKEFEALLAEQRLVIADIEATSSSLAKDLAVRSALLTTKEQEIEAKNELVTCLEMRLAEKEAEVASLALRSPAAKRPASPFEIPYSDALQITPLLAEAVKYLGDIAALHVAARVPANTLVHATYTTEDNQEVLTYAVVRQEQSLAKDARRLIFESDKEHQHVVDFKAEATLFVSKVNLVTRHIENLKVAECMDLARDFSHLLVTGGLSVLRVVSNMSASLKLDKIERKIDHIILLLNAEQIGRFNGIFLAAGEEYRLGTIDQVRVMHLRHELLRLECEVLAELRCLLASAPDVTAFQLKWGQMKRASREAFYNKHFLGAIGKIRLALAAFLVDLILAQETSGREHFLGYTVKQQAKELEAITTILGSQLLVVKDADRVEDAMALHAICEEFRRSLEYLAATPLDFVIPEAA